MLSENGAEQLAAGDGISGALPEVRRQTPRRVADEPDCDIAGTDGVSTRFHTWPRLVGKGPSEDDRLVIEARRPVGPHHSPIWLTFVAHGTSRGHQN
jgi:hypothetical protein